MQRRRRALAICFYAIVSVCPPHTYCASPHVQMPRFINLESSQRSWLQLLKLASMATSHRFALFGGQT